AVVGDGHCVEAGERACAGGRIGDRGGREYEDRLARPPGDRVVRGDTAEPAQDLGDVRAEDAAVAVALVDDHDTQAAEEAAPPGVAWQHRAVQHVRIGQQVIGV